MSHENASRAQPGVRMNPKTAKAQHFPGADPTNPFHPDDPTRGNSASVRTADLAPPPSPSSTGSTMAKDPVCGQQVEPNNALKAVFNDKPYYFCHANCKNQFDQDPQRYIGTRPDNRSLNNSSDKPNGLTPPA